MNQKNIPLHVKVDQWRKFAEDRGELACRVLDDQNRWIHFDISFCFDDALIKYRRIGFFACTSNSLTSPNDYKLKDLMGQRVSVSVSNDLTEVFDIQQMLDALEIQIMSTIYNKIYHKNLRNDPI